jgi:hypothetical protein
VGGAIWPNFVPDANYVPSGPILRKWWDKLLDNAEKAFKVTATDVIAFITGDKNVSKDIITATTVLKSALAGI